MSLEELTALLIAQKRAIKRVEARRAPCTCTETRCRCGWLVYLDGLRVSDWDTKKDVDPKQYRNALAHVRRLRRQLVRKALEKD